MKAAIVTLFVLCCALACYASIAPPDGIRLDFTSDSQGYAGADWDWTSSQGVPAGCMRRLGSPSNPSLTKSPTDTMAIGTPGIMSVSASFQAMSSDGMGGAQMNYRLRYSDGSTEERALGIYGIGGYGGEWNPVAEVVVTTKPLTSIELVSLTAFAPYGVTYVFIDAVSITATAAGLIYEPACGISNRAARDPIMQTASANFRFKLYGQVTLIDGDWFSLDDGSGAPISVLAPGYSTTSIGSYASAMGRLDTTTYPPTLTSSAGEVVPLQ